MLTSLIVFTSLALVLLTAPAGAEVPVIISILRSDTFNTDFGLYSIIPADDQNGDGLNDFFVWDERHTEFLYLGSRDTIATYASRAFTGVYPSGRNLGDINGDGFSDFAWAVWWQQGGNTAVYYGGPTADDQPDQTYGSNLSSLGYALWADFDADGENELVVWSADNNYRMLYETGAGADTAADLLFRPYDFPLLGWTFGAGGAAGDFNGDGYDDLVLNLTPSEIYEVKGQVWFYAGGPGFDTVPELRFTQPGPYSDSRGRFGRILINLGDVNGDQFDDLYAAPGNSADSLGYIYFGGPGFDSLPEVTLADNSETACAAGDINSDGYADLLVGMPLPLSGYVYAYYGGPAMDSVADVRIYASQLPVYTTDFGKTLAGLGDVNGDHVNDFAVGGSGDFLNGRMIIFSGTGNPTDVDDEPEQLPQQFTLAPNYPNPFNGETTIEFSLPQNQHVTVEVVNALGQKVATLMDRPMQAGVHRLRWSAKDASGHDLPSGIYFCRVRTADAELSQGMVLVK